MVLVVALLSMVLAVALLLIGFLAVPTLKRTFIASHPRGELVASTASPDGTLEALLYQQDTGGAVGDSFVRVDVRRSSSGEQFPVYLGVTWGTEVSWIDDDTLFVNGTRLDVPGGVHIYWGF
jgi:hypothetical protein